jgi:hypothetical protein
LERFDPDKLAELIERGDRENYFRRLEFAREEIPELAAIREQSLSRLAKIYGEDEFPWEMAEKGLMKIAEESTESRKALEEGLLSKAQEQLDLGGKLGPEFQAELVRTGLEEASTTGTGVDKKGSLAQLLGNKIGSAQVALEQVRLGNATSLAQAADAMKANRANILAGILPALMSTTQFSLGLGEEGLKLFEAGVPRIGLDGREMGQLAENARKESNEIKLRIAGLKGQRDMAGAAADANLARSIAGGLGSLSGLFAGGLNPFGSVSVAGGAPPPLITSPGATATGAVSAGGGYFGTAGAGAVNRGFDAAGGLGTVWGP